MKDKGRLRNCHRLEKTKDNMEQILKQESDINRTSEI